MTSPITNPWHSRPIDVHRSTDHPEVAAIVDRLWTAHFEDFRRPERSGPKPRTSFKNQFKVLILDLFVAWKADPELCIGVPMSSTAWQTTSRYNALRISRNITLLIGRAHQVGLIDLARGSYAGPYGPANRNTRIRASGQLQQVFANATFGVEDVQRPSGQECIILKEEERYLEYEDDDNTRGMRERLTAYNALLQQTFIDIPLLEQPYIERLITIGRDAGQTVRVATTPDRKFVRRIFSRGRWDMNGRFYGPWWQQVGKDWRSQIFIDDQPTVEIDFKGLHITLLSLEAGVGLEGDPYALPDAGLENVNRQTQRELVKSLVLKAINAQDRQTAFSSFREDWPTGHFAKRLTNRQLSELLDLFVTRHPHLEDKLCADHGIRLMFLDSCITDQVLTVATSFNLPVLGIHDSFIVAREDQETLLQVIQTATREIVGAELSVEVTSQTQNSVRSDGYRARLHHHQTQFS